ncbi:major facilitator superfamily domain-containing protein 7-b [Myriangium duriaei CBS 260.36]|uniref:Major facilitator superfamily domain-containing protein 7-b n=1 Tax=Myriangium duriaei CBS 260.36 TaxID=1168546 RepID=A0A9P4J1T4_9PEZI|nr:major facilitator superfamily domain-containing protein 7-b [Myriangium duriaei CBS 260.36]
MRPTQQFNVGGDGIHYRVYKRRFFGLVQLALLNIIVSWDWLTFSAASKTSAQFFDVSEAAINWLSTGFMFAFLISCPAVIWVLNRYPPKMAIVIASVLTLVGNWLRYAGARSGQHGSFGLVVFGQVIIGMAQPFVLASPTRYSDAWFSSAGRVSATAVASLANPLGGALGQLIGPMWATGPSQVPNMVLYTSIIASVASIPSFFLPSLPPTPPSPSTSLREARPLLQELRILFKNKHFWFLLLPFSVYVAAFNATSSLLNQIFEPYGFSEDQAGIAGAVLIFVGLACSAIVSPIIDRTKAYLLTLKMLMPLISVCYLILVFIPQTRSFPAVCIVMALIGGASFAVLPCALEYLVEITWPVSPEASSVTAWAGGQLIGGLFVIIMTALKGSFTSKPTHDQPQDTMIRALVLQAVFCLAILPAAMLIGVGMGTEQQRGRLTKDTGATATPAVGEDTTP